MQKITPDQLIQEANRLILTRFAPGRHHVATALSFGQVIYYGLHLDSHGIDACGEPSALSAGFVAGHKTFDLIVSVHWDGDSAKTPAITSPCGNCRQLLLDTAPGIEIIVWNEEEGGYETVSARELLPYPYVKPT